MTNSTGARKSMWQLGYTLYHTSPLSLRLPQVISGLQLNAEQEAEVRAGFREAEFDQFFEDLKADVKSLEDPGAIADAMNALADAFDGFTWTLDEPPESE